jgi:hypothetical protein
MLAAIAGTLSPPMDSNNRGAFPLASCVTPHEDAEDPSHTTEHWSETQRDITYLPGALVLLRLPSRDVHNGKNIRVKLTKIVEIHQESAIVGVGAERFHIQHWAPLPDYSLRCKRFPQLLPVLRDQLALHTQHQYDDKRPRAENEET